MSVMARKLGGLFGMRTDAARPRAGVLARNEAAPGRVQSFDQALLWVTVALLAFGLVMVYSASIAMPDNPKFSRYAHTYFLTRHAFFLVISFVAALITFQVPVATWERVAPWRADVGKDALFNAAGVGRGQRRWLVS